ncbi:MAG: flavin reductase family protein [Thermosphaera sp.]
MVSVPTIEILREVWVFGSKSGPGKLFEARVTFEKPSAVNVPLIKGASANLECKVIGMHDYGDHTLFIGEVVAYKYDERVYRDDEPKPGSGFILHIARDKFTVEEGSVITPK